MRRALERVGDRVLRAVVPQRQASACGWTGWTVIWSGSSSYEQERTNTCTGAKQCRVVIDGITYGASCP